MNKILIGKVKDENGCWGNMAPFPILYQGFHYLTTEALFQCLRFDDESIKDKIREQKSPMAAKMIAKKYKSFMIVRPMSEGDLSNMKICLNLKLEQHPHLIDLLKATGNNEIIEDCTKRQNQSGLFWGSALIEGNWVGQNHLGKLWMKLRTSIAEVNP